MSSEPGVGGPAGLTRHDLLATAPPYLRGTPGPGRRGPGGERPGRGQAPGLDFDGLAAYRPGDDIRHIDWKATARIGRTQVRTYRATAHRARMVVPDLGAALRFGTDRRLMARTAALTAARLLWEAQTLGEPTGLALSARAEPPRRGRGAVLGHIDALLAAWEDAEAQVDLPNRVEAAAQRIRAGDEVFVIGELLPDTEALVRIGAALSDRLHLHGILVEDAMTRRPLASGLYPAQAAGERRTFRITARAARVALAGAQAARQTAIDRLRDAGWHIETADAVLAGRPIR